VKTQPTVVVDRIKAETLDMDNFCLGCHVEIMGPYMYGTSALLWKFICNRECKVIVYSLFPK
jgi:hypothetical protein